MKQKIHGIKIYEIDTMHVEAYMMIGTNTTKFITLEDFKKYLDSSKKKTTIKTTIKTITKTTTKKKKKVKK